MLRKIGGVIAGYVVMALFVFLSFTLSQAGMARRWKKCGRRFTRAA